MIVRGFEMEKGVDYVDHFSPTPGLAVARLMMSLAIVNDMELHKIDIEQAFLQADDDVFYLFLQKQKIGAELHIYLEEGTYHKRLFRGPNTNDMKK
jgi:hypothetical protein